MTEPIQQPSADELNKSIDINKLLFILTNRWYIIVGCISLALAITYIQLRYTKPLYSASTTIKFEDERGGQVSDLFKYGRISGRIENLMKTEAEVLRSRSLSRKTLEYMGMYTSAYIEGNIITSRLYPNKSFEITSLLIDSSDIGRSFTITIAADGTYELITGNGKVKHKMGDTIAFRRSVFVIKGGQEEYMRMVANQPITVVVNNLNQMGESMGNALEVNLEKNTNIMRLTMTSDIADFATDYVNALATVYIKESVNSKTSAIEQTINYIDLQLEDLAKRVSLSQDNLANFKSENKGMNPQDLGKAEFERLVTYETEKNILQLRKQQLEVLDKEVQRSKTKPVELVVVDAEDASSLQSLFELHNQAILERLAYIGKYNESSPVMKDNAQKIAELKAAATRAIANVINGIDANLKNKQQRINEINTSLSGLPAKEQNLFNLERTFKINEKIYGYLQEKRLENLITLSAIVSNISLIDASLVNRSPIFPKPSRNYAIAFFIGLAAGVGFIFISRYVYNKIPDKETIESMSRVPVIGVIKKIDQDQKTSDYGIYVYKNPKSIFAESIRGIRTNTNFILKGEKNKVICITSSVSGEGKTFCTVNIAASVTQLGYKVVIVGCDLRRPKLHESFEGLSNQVGLTSYLVKRATLEEVVLPTGYENLYIVPAGPTPPNPAELLQTSEFDEFINSLRSRFDYIFFDTAPVGLVSDSLTLMAKSDINLFVIRAQYSKRDFALTPDRLLAENNIKQIYTILNSYDSTAVAYSSIYKNEYGGYYGSGSYYYYGGYYNKGGYGYYGKNYHSSYYSGYYTDEDMNGSSKSSWMMKWWPFKKKKG
ncbi:MAG: polysaccharide biosynthesis tyrosine autokinase [Bacteroidia bacterium]|jgi:capsular exopolysaccharide synthesis family protein|nr:polysaccharide biosynthesis tyrosine autokinase [Bacteroidia bacterium]